MSIAAYLPALVLAVCMLATAALGASLAALWLALLGAGAVVQVHALWRHYRR